MEHAEYIIKIWKAYSFIKEKYQISDLSDIFSKSNIFILIAAFMTKYSKNIKTIS